MTSILAELQQIRTDTAYGNVASTAPLLLKGFPWRIPKRI